MDSLGFLCIRHTGIGALGLCFLLSACSIPSPLTPETENVPTTQEITTQLANSFPHPPRNIWVQNNPKDPVYFHGYVLAQRGMQACVSCHGADLSGGSSHVACASCHVGFPGQHRLLGDQLDTFNPNWAGATLQDDTHHAKRFEGLSPAAMKEAAAKNCTTICHTPVEQNASAPVGDCVGCHHGTSETHYSALSAQQAPTWAAPGPSTHNFDQLHHKNIFSRMTLANKNERVTTDCNRCHITSSQEASQPTGECFSCHHSQKDNQTWMAFTESHAQEWNKAALPPTPITDFHHKNTFKGLTPSTFKLALERCDACHAQENTLTSCKSCHHGMKSSDPAILSYNAYGENAHFFARRIDNTDKKYHPTHHGALFSDPEKFDAVKNSCESCHSTVHTRDGAAAIGNFCLSCHHDTRQQAVKYNALPEFNRQSFASLSAHPPLVNRAPETRKNCLLCHNWGDVVTRPEHLILQQAYPDVDDSDIDGDGCRACHDDAEKTYVDEEGRLHSPLWN